MTTWSPWTLQWVSWPVAIGEYLALTAAYYALPALLRGPEKAAAVGSPP